MAEPAAEPDPTPSGDPSPDPTPAPGGEPPAEPSAEPANFFESAPETWRQDWLAKAGIEGDEAEKRLGQLNRVTDISGVLKNYFESQDKIRKGEVSTGLPENPTDEQLASWREANNVPAEAGAYELSLDEGLVLSEMDQRIMEGVFSTAHENNIPSGAVNGLVNAMLSGREREEQALLQQDGMDKQDTTRLLKDAWGNDYATNVQLVNNVVGQLPETVQEVFKTARLGDGKMLFNSPEVAVFFADIARRLDPTATVVPAGDTNPIQTINDEIASLEKKMSDGISDGSWHRDKASNARLDELYEAKAHYDSQQS